MRIYAIGQRGSGVSFHRLFNPMMYMEKEYCLMSDKLDVKELEKGYDIVFINRYIPSVEVDQIVKLREQYGFKLIVDIDDYWHLDPWHILYGKYPTKKVMDHIVEADHVTCTNEQLYFEIRELNPEVSILPNALPFGKDQFANHWTKSDKTRFVYAGSVTHEKDIAILRNPMKRAAVDQFVKTQSQFILCGYDPESKGTLPTWHRMINDYLCGFKVEGYVRGALPVEQYMNFYNEADVCLVPLVDSKFNNCKSILKVLEAATRNAAVISSNIKPYSEMPFIIPVNSQADWFVNIKKCIKFANYRKDMGEANGEYCRQNYDLIKINKERKQIFESVL
jgi:hypothetical protein